MYYRMRTMTRMLTAFIDKEHGPSLYKLTMGRLYNAPEGKLPFRFSWQDAQNLPLLDYISGKSLMSKRLAETLEGAGVDNLQKFDAVLRNADTGEVNEDFCVVNIVGLVSSADMAQSDALPLGGGQVFTDLKIETDAARGLLMFRLEESQVDVIVHDRVAGAVEAGGFRGVLLTPVSD